jgi:hypothetical protein
VTAFARRLPHVVTRADLVLLLAPTYAQALSVDEEEARERLARALERRPVLDDVYRALGEALEEERGPRTSADTLLDRISAKVAVRRARARAAPETPAISAALVRMNLEIGLAPEGMRATLASDRGAALLEAGLRALGAHLARELLR